MATRTCPCIVLYRVSQTKFRRLEGYGIKSMCPIFKTKMLIYQSKANLDVKILFGNIARLIDPEIRKMLEKGFVWSKVPYSILVNDLLAIEIKIHF